jgi:hypothetical protein
MIFFPQIKKNFRKNHKFKFSKVPFGQKMQLLMTFSTQEKGTLLLEKGHLAKLPTPLVQIQIVQMSFASI